MNDEPQPTPATGPAQRRLDEHLELLRLAPPQAGSALIARTLHAAHWQREIRGPLRVVGMIAGALLDGVLSLIGRRGMDARR